MKTLIQVILFLLTACPAFSQKTMMVEKIGTSRRYFFYKDDFIKIRSTNPDTLLKGKLWHIGDSSIFVYGWRQVEVNLRDASSVYKKFLFPAKFGRLIGIGGIGIFAIITVNHLINNEQVFTPDMFLISGSMLAVSAISLSLSEKRCRIGNRWKIKILDYPLN
jgi:hypothetical protein